MLAHVLDENRQFEDLRHFKKAYTSQLMRIEALRTIDRMRILEKWSDEEVAKRINLFNGKSEFIEMVPLQPAILERAANPFSVIIKTLDAIHLATAMLVEKSIEAPLLFLTHDSQLALAASASGFTVEGIDE